MRSLLHLLLQIVSNRTSDREQRGKNPRLRVPRHSVTGVLCAGSKAHLKNPRLHSVLPRSPSLGRGCRAPVTECPWDTQAWILRSSWGPLFSSQGRAGPEVLLVLNRFTQEPSLHFLVTWPCPRPPAACAPGLLRAEAGGGEGCASQHRAPAYDSPALGHEAPAGTAVSCPAALVSHLPSFFLGVKLPRVLVQGTLRRPSCSVVSFQTLPWGLLHTLLVHQHFHE